MENLEKLKTRLKNTEESLKTEFLALRIGRATPALVENILVDYYGAKAPLKQFASKLNKTNLTHPAQLIGRGIYFEFAVMGLLTLIFYIYGGVLYMTSAGNAERRSQGIKIIVWTTLGIVAILLSYWAVTFIFSELLK